MCVCGCCVWPALTQWSRQRFHRREETQMARTTHRSTGGKKLYAVRDEEGQFKDIQTYKRAHGQDVKRVSKAEVAAKKAAKKKAAAKAVVKKAPAKKAAKKAARKK